MITSWRPARCVAEGPQYSVLSTQYSVSSLALRALVLLTVFGCAPVMGGEVVRQKDKVTVRLLAPQGEGDKLVVPLSETLLVIVTVEGPPFPGETYLPVPRLSREWEVKPQPPTADGSRWERQFILDPRGATGSLKLQLEPLELGGARVTWDPIPVEVTTQVSRADLNETRDVRPPEDAPPLPPPTWPLWVGGGVGVLVLAALALGAWGVSRRRRPKPPPLLPHEWALREFDRIDALGLPEAGEVNRYHTLLSEVLRRYIELRFSLPASRQTTAEFLRSVQTSGAIPAPQQDLLRDILERCDLAKFAPVALSADDCRETGRLCRRFVLETK